MKDKKCYWYFIYEDGVVGKSTEKITMDEARDMAEKLNAADWFDEETAKKVAENLASLLKL